MSLPADSRAHSARFPEWFAFGYAVLAAAAVVLLIQPVPTMAAPVVVTALPLLVSGRAVRIVAALLLTVFVALGALTVGVLFVPAVFALVLAAGRARHRAPAV